MRKNHNFTLIFIALLTTFILVACGNNANVNSTTSNDSATNESNSSTTSESILEETEIGTDHTHSYTDTITKEATCTLEGEKTFTCKCGDTYTEPMTATGHNYEDVANTSTPSTCTKEGKNADQLCSVCGDKVTGAKLPVASHSYGEYVYNNDATQSADGTKSSKCNVCGKVDTQTAVGTKLPFDPYSLRAVSSLDTIPSAGTMTASDDSIYDQVRANIEAGKYEKIRYVASNGDQFCMWNVRVYDTRNTANGFPATYYWFMAPCGDGFSNGYNYCNLSQVDSANADRYLIKVGNNISGSIHESMINCKVSLPPAFRTINTAECPVNLYQIVETDDMITVWVESTNCGQAGIGTCGSFNCSGTCLRSTTLAEFDKRPGALGWINRLWGENGRINWNGKLLVCFYYLKY